MATFLQLAQRVARESGTGGNGVTPSTVVGQTGRNAKFVYWTADAWRQLQNAKRDWFWLQDTFSGPTVSGTRNYSGTDLGVASRFAEFTVTGDEEEDRYSIYLTATGVSDEGPLRFMDYRTFFTEFMRGTQTNSRPNWFTIAPNGELLLHPIPDAIYTVRGPYRKDVQELVADADVPEMPARHHDLIADMALIMLGTGDEAPAQIPLWQMRQLGRFSALTRDQLPRFTFNGTLA